MRNLQNLKKAVAIAPVSLTSGNSATSVLIDTAGYKECVVDVVLGTLSSTPHLCALCDTDDTNTTTLATISGFVATVVTNSSSGQVITFEVGDTLAHDRYLGVRWAPASTVLAGATANLNRGRQAPDGNTDQNANVLTGI